MMRRVAVLTSLTLLAACAPEAVAPPSFPVTPREAGVRAPRTAACTELEDVHCLLPWPSSEFLRADATSATGVRLDVSAASLNAMDTANAWGADGFSRATSVMAGVPGDVDPASAEAPPGGVSALRLFIASPDHPRHGEEVPLRIETTGEYRGETVRSVIVGDPLALLEPATDYVAVLTDVVRDLDGTSFVAPRATRVALGLEAPASVEEAELAGYHAPTAALLEEVGIDGAHVLRAWDFTTRSAEDPRRFLLSVRDATLAALERGEVRFVVDDVSHRDTGDIATVVRGHITGLPNFVDENADLTLDAAGLPRQIGLDESPFRVTIPRGSGDYRTVLFGHGAGGSANDATFDEALAAEGIAKVGLELTGFHGDVLLETIGGLSEQVLRGIRRAAAPLMQAMAQAVLIERALYGALGDVLSAETLGGAANPHVGRRPGQGGVRWVGGSLGGITGLVITSIAPDIHQAVLNVPACGWTQWVQQSVFYLLAQTGVRRRNGGAVGATIALSVAQSEIDVIDGASFVELGRDDGDVLLVQESMGDEVVPNVGTEYLAIVAGAQMVGAPLSPIEGVPALSGSATGRSAITQFRAEGTDLGAVHGFASNTSTASGRAAMEQIRDFLTSSWEGTPVIHVPSGCPGGACDFSR